MTSIRKPLTYVSMTLLFLSLACQSPKETKKVLYPENEIPVGATSDEALTEFMQGLKLYDEGDIIKSRPYFRKAVELDPDFVRGHMYVAFTSNSNKQWAENRDKFLAMRDKASEPDLMMMDWLQASLDNDNAKELEIINKMIEKYPKSARAVDYLAGYYSGLDNVEKARELWKQAHDLDPDYIPAISSLGSSYLFTSPKDFKTAEKYMQLVVDKLPASSQARIGLGDTYRAQGDLQKALDNYLKAAELDPKNEVAHSKAGHANTFMGNYEKARKNFQDARAVSEFGTGSFNFEGYTYLYEGDPKKALAFLEEGVKMIDAMDIPASNKNSAKMGRVFDCAMIAMHQGDAERLQKMVTMMKPMSKQASEEVNNEITTKYQTANMHYWDAMAMATAGDYKGAAAKADMIKEIMGTIDDPNNMRSFHRVHAYVNYKQGKYKKALEHMAQLDKDNVYDKYWLAKAQMKLGNKEKAKALFAEIANDNFNSVAYALIRNESQKMIAAADK